MNASPTDIQSIVFRVVAILSWMEVSFCAGEVFPETHLHTDRHTVVLSVYNCYWELGVRIGGKYMCSHGPVTTRNMARLFGWLSRTALHLNDFGRKTASSPTFRTNDDVVGRTNYLVGAHFFLTFSFNAVLRSLFTALFQR